MRSPDDYDLDIGTINEEESEVKQMAMINKALLDENKSLRSRLFEVEAQVVKLTNILDKLFEDKE